MIPSKNPLTLLILAGGLGSRYSGSKQIDGIGPNDEFLLEYAIFDALKSGFNKVVIIVNSSVQKILLDRLETQFHSLELVFVEQELMGKNRKKPWGTGHAVLSAKDAIQEPFMVINADDYYGRSTFEIGGSFLSGESLSYRKMGLIAFQLNKTLSDHGGVSRGVCQLNDGHLIKVEEHEGIQKHDGKIYSNQNKKKPLKGKVPVSMNCWLFHQSIFDYLQSGFEGFFAEHSGSKDAEYYLPTAVQQLIEGGEVRFLLMRSIEQWYGLTFAEDKELVQNEIKTAIESGFYPKSILNG